MLLESLNATNVLKSSNKGFSYPSYMATDVLNDLKENITKPIKADKAAPFKDIGQYADATKAEIAAAYQFGIVKGGNGQFNPNEPVTRAQLALMVKRAYELVKQTPYIATELVPYTDIANYDAETKNAISMLHALGIADGTDGKFMPGNATTRGQAAKIFVNYSAVIK